MRYLVALQLFTCYAMHYLIYGVRSEVALASETAAAMRKEVTVVEACRASRNEKIQWIGQLFPLESPSLLSLGVLICDHIDAS